MTAPQLHPYRVIGPFDQDSLPAGLLAEHSLMPGTWARLELTSGAIRFVWDDGDAEAEDLATPDSILIPPQKPHHLEPCGPFELRITFLRPVEARA